MKKHKESHEGKNATSMDMMKQTREVCLTLSNQYCHVVAKKNQGKFLDVLSPARPTLSSSLLCSTIVLYDLMCPWVGAIDASFHTQWRILMALHDMVTVLLEYLTRFQNLVYRISVCVCVGGGGGGLFEWLPQPQSAHGAKVHWRDNLIQEIQY